jgi:uncharacterized membrane protein (DUF2068 family)
MTLETGTRWIRWIALFKLFKASVLLAAVVTSVTLIRHEPTQTLMRWALSFHVDPENYYVHTMLAWLLRIDVKQLALFAVGTGLYALVFAVEGIGLWLLKPWAEYLTILSTAGLLPVEGYELVRHVNIAKCIILLLNAAIVVYLAARVRWRLEARQ